MFFLIIIFVPSVVLCFGCFFFGGVLGCVGFLSVERLIGFLVHVRNVYKGDIELCL